MLSEFIFRSHKVAVLMRNNNNVYGVVNDLNTVQTNIYNAVL